MDRTYFGLQDASGLAYNTVKYGSLRLWDSATSWRNIESDPGVYDWTHLDLMVDQAQSRGIEVSLVIGGYTPACYGAQNSSPPPDAYLAYCTAVMSRYKGRISSYSVWNEANAPYFFAGTQDQLLLLTRLTWEARNAVDPEAKLLSPSWATRLRYEQRQLTGFMSLGAWRYFDIVGLSMYPLVGQGPEEAMKLAATCRVALTNGGAPATMPMWVTEINYDVGPNPSALLPDPFQVAMVLRTYILGACSGIERMHWYRWDWGFVNGRPLANTYLTKPDDHTLVTPAGYALRKAIRWLTGSRPHLRISGDGTHRVRVETPTGTRLIYWHPKIELRVNTPLGPKRVRPLPIMIEVPN